MDTREEFYARLDRAIMTAKGSGQIARAFGIRSESVRARRKQLRAQGVIIEVGSSNVNSTNRIY